MNVTAVYLMQSLCTLHAYFSATSDEPGFAPDSAFAVTLSAPYLGRAIDRIRGSGIYWYARCRRSSRAIFTTVVWNTAGRGAVTAILFFSKRV